MTGPFTSRHTGILLHPTSLPGPHGAGDLGPAAHRWLALLQEAGQTLWQVLPLHPTRCEGSPYQATSAFAGNPVLISLERLVEDGLLPRAEAQALALPASTHAELQAAREARTAALEQALPRLRGARRDQFEEYRRRERSWLVDFALYTALQEHHEGAPWSDWPAELRDRHPDALAAASRELDARRRRVELEQFLLDEQWTALHAEARRRGIRILGDLPIFVALDSADVWAHRPLFRLDEAGRPTVVAGVPPDYFSATGQLWNNPLYDWQAHESSEFEWWRHRVRHLLARVDLARIDHFRGLVACWEIPGGAETAADGQWIDTPGRALLERLEEDLGRPLPLVAEDLGSITEEVTALRDDFELPGIRVLQFAFDSDEGTSSFLPESCIPNCVAYTGTHDNDTLVGWLEEEPSPSSPRSTDEVAAERARVARYVGEDCGDVAGELVRRLRESAASAVILPLQDVLGLGSRARMNVPGQAEGNWTWRLESLDALEAVWPALGEATRAAGRAPQA